METSDYPNADARNKTTGFSKEYLHKFKASDSGLLQERTPVIAETYDFEYRVISKRKPLSEFQNFRILVQITEYVQFLQNPTFLNANPPIDTSMEEIKHSVRERYEFGNGDESISIAFFGVFAL